MKQLFSFLLLLFISQSLLAQAPKEINYQGVARNAQGQALANQVIKVKVSLIKADAVDISDANQITFYTETRTVTTNALGLFSFKINDGGSAVTTGNFNDGNWLTAGTANDQYMKIEMDVNNSGTWTDMGKQKIVSVPYAMYANQATVAQSLSTPSVAFSAQSTSTQTIAAGATAKITFEGLEGFSQNFSTVTNGFTAANSGLHHFTGFIDCSMNAQIISHTFVYLQVLVNGNIRRYFRHQVAPPGGTFSIPFSLNLALQKNDVVSIAIENKLSAGLSVGSESTFFSGNNIR